MSRNFELLRQAETERRFAPVVELKTEPATAAKNNQHSETGAGWKLDQLAREESRKLVQRVFLRQDAEAPRAVVFAGVDHGNGCTGVCARAAVTLASIVSGSVCLVDANLRSPALPEFFGTTNHYGLTDCLRQDGPIRSFVRQLRPENLWLLSCGSLSIDSANFLDSDRLKARLAGLREEFEYVLIDAPPLNQYADGMALGRLADGLVVVVEADSTRRESAVSVTEGLRAAHVLVLGAVLNKRTFPIPDSVYRRL
jgi:Mrp family chromosome partitioning ATPase